MIIILPLSEKSPPIESTLQAFGLTQKDTVIAVLDRCPPPAQLPQGVILLKNRLPRGKGCCIKTALAYMLDHDISDDYMLIWMDGHLPSAQTLPSVYKSLHHTPDALVSGRVLSHYAGSGPFRRIGYLLTRYAFSFAAGLRLQDLAPAFLACSCDYVPKLLELSGEMQGYVTHTLLAFAQENIPLIEIDARPSCVAKDKPNLFYGFWRSYLPLLQYVVSSLFAFVVEYVLFLLLVWFTKEVESQSLVLVINTAVARVISCVVNFAVNRWVVFKHNDALWPAILKFSGMSAILLVMHSLFMLLLVSGLFIPEAIAFLISEIVLFAVGGVLQRIFVFPHDKAEQD